MNIRIRPAVPADCGRIRPLQKEIADLHHAGRPDLFRPEGRYFTEEAFAERLADPAHSVFIAETEAGEVVGYAFAWVLSYRNHPTYRDHDSFYIDDICVLRSHRRHGIGRLLLEQCRRTALDRQCASVELGVWDFNREAMAFYRSCGMTPRTHRMELRLPR